MAAPDKANLCTLGAHVSNPELVYITTLYGTAGATFSEKASHVVSADTDVSDGTIVVGDTAYAFDANQGSRTTLRSAVVNFTGSEVPLSVLCDPDTVERRAVLVPKMAMYNIHPMKFFTKYHRTVYDRLAATNVQAVFVPARVIESMAAKLTNPYVAPVTTAIEVPAAAPAPLPEPSTSMLP